jgi:4'-phosphopantetheinyl transferase EntD
LPNTIASEALLNRQLTLAWSIKEALFKWYGDGEMDFIEHLHIDTLFTDADEGRAQCRISKNDGYHLTVHWLLFNNNCISWVVS